MDGVALGALLAKNTRAKARGPWAMMDIEEALEAELLL